jgi:hypothetical protein
MSARNPKSGGTVAKRLTEPQIELLAALADGGEITYFPYQGRFNPNAYYSLYIAGNGFRRVTAQTKALVARGYAERVKQQRYNDGHEVAITEAGRAALKELA